MQVAVKNISELGDDWRAEAHCPADPGLVKCAYMSGCRSGATGAVKSVSHWQKHGSVEVRDAFESGRASGLKAYAAFKVVYEND